jgi:peptide/nickel transport system substrate-binding protein
MRWAVLFAAAALLAGTSSALSTSVSLAASTGKTVTFALFPATPPTYILPLSAGQDTSDTNIEEFQQLMYRPLYWYGEDGKPIFNAPLSLASPPVYSNAGKTVTITMKHEKWSDGQPVTARDVEFWMNLLIANKDNWYAYVPGEFPDNIVSMDFPSSTPLKFSITFNQAYGHLWLFYNELSQIFPLPQHVWDKTSTSGPVGNYDETAAGAVAAYNFLNDQALDLSTYGSNPLWNVVDGPWRLTNYDPSTGESLFVPNPAYVGPEKPKIARFEEVPFTTAAAEFDALRSGEVDYGYLPLNDLAQKSYLAAHGYSFEPWPFFAFNSLIINFTNPTNKAIFGELYIRQAMEHLINQPEIVHDLLHGYGNADYGPIPPSAPAEYLSSDERTAPYPYSTAAAKELLTSHGWSLHPNGIDKCIRPGDGPADCGAGIASGAALNFPFQFSTGSITTQEEAEAIASSWGSVGIKTELRPTQPDQTLANDVACVPSTGLGCTWSVDLYSDAFHWSYSPDYYPTGDELFDAGSESNFGGYDSAKMTSLIAATETESGMQALLAYENYAATQLPQLWVPALGVQLSEIKTSLRGTLPQDPLEQIYPENWTLGG